jgi:hypothetical protein
MYTRRYRKLKNLRASNPTLDVNPKNIKGGRHFGILVKEGLVLPLAFLLQPVWNLLLGLSHQLQQLGGVTPVVPAQPTQDMGTGGRMRFVMQICVTLYRSEIMLFMRITIKLIRIPPSPRLQRDFHGPLESLQAFTALEWASTDSGLAWTT